MTSSEELPPALEPIDYRTYLDSGSLDQSHSVSVEAGELASSVQYVSDYDWERGAEKNHYLHAQVRGEDLGLRKSTSAELANNSLIAQHVSKSSIPLPEDKPSGHFVTSNLNQNDKKFVPPDSHPPQGDTTQQDSSQRNRPAPHASHNSTVSLQENPAPSGPDRPPPHSNSKLGGCVVEIGGFSAPKPTKQPPNKPRPFLKRGTGVARIYSQPASRKAKEAATSLGSQDSTKADPPLSDAPPRKIPAKRLSTPFDRASVVDQSPRLANKTESIPDSSTTSTARKPPVPPSRAGGYGGPGLRLTALPRPHPAPNPAQTEAAQNSLAPHSNLSNGHAHGTEETARTAPLTFSDTRYATTPTALHQHPSDPSDPSDQPSVPRNAPYPGSVHTSYGLGPRKSTLSASGEWDAPLDDIERKELEEFERLEREALDDARHDAPLHKPPLQSVDGHIDFGDETSWEQSNNRDPALIHAPGDSSKEHPAGVAASTGSFDTASGGDDRFDSQRENIFQRVGPHTIIGEEVSSVGGGYAGRFQDKKTWQGARERAEREQERLRRIRERRAHDGVPSATVSLQDDSHASDLDAPVSPLVDNYFGKAAQNAENSMARKPNTSGQGPQKGFSAASSALGGGAVPSNAHRGSRRGGADGWKGRDSDSESDSHLQSRVEEKLAVLDAEVNKFQALKSELAHEKQLWQEKTRQQTKELEAGKKELAQQRKAFEEWKEAEEKKVKHEKRQAEKAYARSQMRVSIERKDKEELHRLQEENAKLQQELKSKDSKARLTIERLRREKDSLAMQVEELQQDLRALEQRRLDALAANESKHALQQGGAPDSGKPGQGAGREANNGKKPVSWRVVRDGNAENAENTGARRSSVSTKMKSTPSTATHTSAQSNATKIPAPSQGTAVKTSATANHAGRKNTRPGGGEHSGRGPGPGNSTAKPGAVGAAVGRRSSGSDGSQDEDAETNTGAPSNAKDSAARANADHKLRPTEAAEGNEYTQNDFDVRRGVHRGADVGERGDFLDIPGVDMNDIPEGEDDCMALVTGGHISPRTLRVIEEVESGVPLTGSMPVLDGDEEPVQESQYPDGKIEQLFRDRRKVIHFANGTTKEMLPSGEVHVYFNNGDVKQTFPGKCVVYYYAEVGTVHVTYPDGVEDLEFGNGQFEKHFADGTKLIIYPDKTVKTVYIDASERSMFPDGSTQFVMPSGASLHVPAVEV